VLLRYPDEDLKVCLPDVGSCLAQFPESPAITNCMDFLTYLETTPLRSLQEEYTRTFDLNGTTCLNLTFHEWGDSRERGMALVDLKQLYKAEGYEPLAGELPDYLPMMLEFLTVCPDLTCAQLVSQYSKHISALAGRLKERGSPYSRPVEVVSLICQEHTATGD